MDPLSHLVRVAARDVPDARKQVYMCELACEMYGDPGAELLTRDTGVACRPCLQAPQAPQQAPQPQPKPPLQ